MEIFKIWSTFDLKGNAISKMERFTQLTKLASESTTKLTRNIGLLTTAFATFELNAGNSIKKLSRLSELFLRINDRTKLTSDRMRMFDSSTNKAANGARNLVNATGQLANNLSHVALASARASIALGDLRGARIGASMGGRGGAGGGRRSGGGFTHGLLAGLGAESLGVGAAAVGGYALGSTLIQGFKSSTDYSAMLGQLTALGYTPSQVESANSFVMGSHIQGVSKIQMLQAYLDAQMASREAPSVAIGANSEVKQFAPLLAKLQFSANMYGGLDDHELQSAIRASEILGGSSVGKRKDYLNAIAQIMVSSALSIKPSEIRTFARQAGGTFGSLSPEALVGLEPLLQEQGGAKMATALVTGLRALITGTGSNFNKKQINFLEKIGLLKASYDPWGRPLGVQMPSQYAHIAQTDPFAFLMNVILPLFKKSGIDINDTEAVNSALILGFPRTYANQLATEYKSRLQIQRQRDQLHHIGGIESQYQLALGQGKTAPKLVSAAWSDFTKAIGDVTAPAVTMGLKILAAGLERLAEIITNNFAPSAKGAGEFFSSLSKVSGALPPGLIPGSGIINAVSSAMKPPVSSNTTVSLHVDHKKLASAVIPGLTPQMHGGGVLYGTAPNNISLTPTSTNYNAVGLA